MTNARVFLLSRFGNHNVTPAHVAQLEKRDADIRRVAIKRCIVTVSEMPSDDDYEENFRTRRYVNCAPYLRRLKHETQRNW